MAAVRGRWQLCISLASANAKLQCILMHALVAVDQPNITTWNGRRDVTDGMPADLEVVGAGAPH
jgi:hypothetical protein